MAEDNFLRDSIWHVLAIQQTRMTTANGRTLTNNVEDALTLSHVCLWIPLHLQMYRHNRSLHEQYELRWQFFVVVVALCLRSEYSVHWLQSAQAHRTTAVYACMWQSSVTAHPKWINVIKLDYIWLLGSDKPQGGEMLNANEVENYYYFLLLLCVLCVCLCFCYAKW